MVSGHHQLKQNLPHQPWQNAISFEQAYWYTNECPLRQLNDPVFEEQEDAKLLRSYIHNITRMLIIVSTLAAIGVSIFFIVYSFYFNITLKDYWLLFAVLVAGQLVNNWTGPVGIVLQVTNNEKIFNRITMLFGAYLVFSTFILAKFFDIYIIAINMLLYLSCVNYFALRVQKRKLDIRPHKKLLKK